MKDRLLLLMQAKGISPAKFAEKIGFQRSAISHILSGRNKPSYDFLLKIIENFPDVNVEWLFTGKGMMLKAGITDMQNSRSIDDDSEPELFTAEESGDNDIESVTDSFSNRKEMASEIRKNREGSVHLPENQQNKPDQIEKIVILFRDKTFIHYKPR